MAGLSVLAPVGSKPAVSPAESLSPAKQKEAAKLKGASQEFESLFIGFLLNKMSESTFNTGGFMAESDTQKLYKDMYNQELARSLSKAGGLGMANMLYKQLAKLL